jgi:uncharacterized protein YndB with AHSA1/START domain
MNAPESKATADREIVTERVIDAPRERVWQVWTDPEHVRQWWGPTGFSTTTQSMDVRVGGQWRYVMHGPDGRDYANLITYQEVQAPARLVYRHGGEKEFEHVNFTTTVTFEELPGATPRTKVTMRAVFPSAAARDLVVREYNAVEGGKQHLTRLAEYARGATPASTPFVIRRVVRAPRELVWRLWTEREHLAQWFGPKGCTIPVCEIDLRPGGTFHYCMRFAGGADMWGKWVFTEVAAPDRLAMVTSFSDQTGSTCRAPFDGWPLEMTTIVTFEEHAGIGKGTVVTVTSSAHQASAAEQKTFDDHHGSMQQGWSGTFEQLEAYLARL